MNKEQLARLKELAERASGCPWNVFLAPVAMDTTGAKQLDSGPHAKANNLIRAMAEASAAFISAVSPAVVLALLEKFERLEEEANLLAC